LPSPHDDEEKREVLGTAFKRQRHRLHQHPTVHYLLKRKRLFQESVAPCTCHCSDDDTLLALGFCSAQECSTSSILEDLPDALASASGAFEVMAGANLLSDGHTLQFHVSSKVTRYANKYTNLLRGHRTLVGLPELLDCLRVTSQVLLATNQDDGQAGAKVHDLGDPLHES
jgi:hypothetical protein